MALVLTVISTTTVEAQSSLEGFFRKNGAETVFSPEIKQTDQRDVVLLRDQEKAKPEEEKKKPEEKKVEKEPEKPDDRRLNQPETPEEILAAYGDPSAPYPVAATEDAPGFAEDVSVYTSQSILFPLSSTR